VFSFTYLFILFLEEVQIFIWTTLQSQQPDGNDWTNVKWFNVIDDPYSVSFTGEFLPIFDLKNMVILRIFHEKMDPNSADIEFFFFKLPDLYDKFQVDSQNIEQFYFLLLSYLVCYQMWLNYFENDRHFGYHKILKRSWVQTKWRAGEIPAGSLLLGLTWGLRQQLVSRVCCFVPKKI